MLQLYSMLRSNASGPEIGLPGRILAGLLPGKHRNRPSGRPKAVRRADVGAFPVAVRPKSGPEDGFLARKHYCITLSTSNDHLRCGGGPICWVRRGLYPRSSGTRVVDGIIHQRYPAVVFWPSLFWEAWGTKAKKPHIFQKQMFLLALPPKAAGPNNHCSGKLVVFWPWCPRPPKSHLATKTLRAPFEFRGAALAAKRLRPNRPQTLDRRCCVS